jgi:hypothetical protein
MGLQLHDLRLLWVKIIEGGAPEFFERVFEGSIEEAAEYFQGQANEQKFAFGQIVDADGRVISNIVPHSR